MIVFVDASALVALIEDEPDRPAIEDRLEEYSSRITNGIAIWETARAVGKRRHASEAAEEVARYCVALEIRCVPIGPDEALAALDANARYGKGTHHPAKLNMGDCFAYACAKTNGAALLYKGDDFSRMDLA